MEQEGQAEKKQLVALHQQRVQADMNERKRHAMEHYMSALQKPTPDVRSLLIKIQTQDGVQMSLNVHFVFEFALTLQTCIEHYL